MGLSVYTFADEGFVPALAGLINSVRHQGFKGMIHVGSPEQLSVSGEMCEGVEFHVIGPSDYCPTNRKAELLLAHPSERFVYLDADIIVVDPAFFERMDQWLNIAPVFAVEALLTSIDSRRHMWARRLGRERQPDKWPNYYFNAGLFGGIIERDRLLLDTWRSAIRMALTPPGDPLCDVDFPFSDQDVLNAVLQDWEPRPIGVGPPDIWNAASPLNPFLHVGTFRQTAVLHCTGQRKPWKVVRVPGRTPSAYDIAWYEHAILKPRPLQAKIVFSLSVQSWFEQRRWLRLISWVRRTVRRVFGTTGP